MKFSQRLGITPIKLDLQVDSMDEDLRNSIWNIFKVYILDNISTQFITQSKYYYLFRELWVNFFIKPLDTLEILTQHTIEQIREIYFNFEWYEVYDFIEFLVNIDLPGKRISLSEIFNIILERELSGYRFIEGILTPITDESELKEIEEAVKNSKNSMFSGVHSHLTSSLQKISDRKNPDYRNSIKESISAVESLVRIITQDSKSELGKALRMIEDKIELHPALKKGFSAIYGYTSDEQGIRHSMLETKECSFEDAKYMLSSCSAFINYLMVKSEKAGIFK